MYVFQPLNRVQIFKETVPAQVRSDTWTLNYEGFSPNLLEELKKHAKEVKPSEQTIIHNEKQREKASATRQAKQEQLLLYEQKKMKLLENKDLGDAYCTVFVAHIPVSAKEKDLRKLFEKFGPVVNVTLIRRTKVKAGKTKARKGYAFVVFGNRNDAKKAVSHASTIGGSRMMTINGQRLVVDVERGRVVKNWLPKKLRK